MACLNKLNHCYVIIKQIGLTSVVGQHLFKFITIKQAQMPVDVSLSGILGILFLTLVRFSPDFSIPTFEIHRLSISLNNSLRIHRDLSIGGVQKIHWDSKSCCVTSERLDDFDPIEKEESQRTQSRWQRRQYQNE